VISALTCRKTARSPGEIPWGLATLVVKPRATASKNIEPILLDDFMPLLKATGKGIPTSNLLYYGNIVGY